MFSVIIIFLFNWFGDGIMFVSSGIGVVNNKSKKFFALQELKTKQSGNRLKLNNLQELSEKLMPFFVAEEVNNDSL